MNVKVSDELEETGPQRVHLVAFQSPLPLLLSQSTIRTLFEERFLSCAFKFKLIVHYGKVRAHVLYACMQPNHAHTHASPCA